MIRSEEFDWKKAHEQEYAITAGRALPETDTDASEKKYISALHMLSLRENAKAEKLFTELYKDTGGSIPSRWGLAEVYRRQYRTQESSGMLDALIQEAPDFIPARISRAYMYFEEDQYREAVRMAEQVLKRAPDGVDTGNVIRAHLIIAGAKGMLAQQSLLFSKLTKGLSALSHLKTAWRKDPGDPGVLFAWASYHMLAPAIAGRDFEKAEKYLLIAIDKSPKFVDAHVRLAELYYIKGNTELYLKHITKAEEIDPRNKLLREIRKMVDTDE